MNLYNLLACQNFEIREMKINLNFNFKDQT